MIELEQRAASLRRFRKVAQAATKTPLPLRLLRHAKEKRCERAGAAPRTVIGESTHLLAVPAVVSDALVMAADLGAGALYDGIGATYSGQRRTDPRIATHILQSLGDARTVLNVGAGTGSYEPTDREVTAVEPSQIMREQRPEHAAPCIAARAEALPFADGSFDVAMAVLSDHRWQDPIAGLLEMRRVAARVVVFQWDNTRIGDFWLVRDYLPEFLSAARARPTLAERAKAIGAAMTAVPIPWDCEDGFFHSYWRRPDAYLQAPVRRGTSVWAVVGAQAERRAVSALSDYLASGAWHERNRALLELQEAELGARLLTT